MVRCHFVIIANRLILFIIVLFLSGVCNLYERGLKELNPNIRNVTYDLSDIFKYIDELADLCFLL